MNWSLFFDLALLLLAVFLAVFIGLVLFQLFNLLRLINREIKPTLSRVQTLIEEVNTELERTGEIVKQAQAVSRKVDTTTKIAQEIISSPLIRLAALGAGLRKALSTLTKRNP